MIETASEHLYYDSGRWIRGYGSSLNPHRCGNDRCKTIVSEREVSEWKVIEIVERGTHV